MRIAVIGGTGYVGLVTGACLANIGNKVICVDINKNKITDLKRGKIPIFEPGLEEIVKKGLKEKRLSFTTEPEEGIKDSEIIFIAVGTPPLPDGKADLSQVEAAAGSIGKYMDGYRVVVNKSTVPIGTGELVKEIIHKKYKGEFSVVSNPEFLREGDAVSDCQHPDRIIIGCEDEKARSLMQELYKPLDCPILFTDLKTAEIIKYASNAFLATSISFINTVADLCDKVGADISLVAEGMKMDSRIGKRAFLRSGLGYGGSCFPKDVKALIKMAETHNSRTALWEEVENVNSQQKEVFLNKIREVLGDLKGKKIAVWGLAFKPQTNDMRDAPAIDIIKQLYSEGAEITAYDPIAEAEAKKILDEITYHDSCYGALEGNDILIILTEWDEFKQCDLDEVKRRLVKPIIIDGRNIFNPGLLAEKGIRYIGMGR